MQTWISSEWLLTLASAEAASGGSLSLAQRQFGRGGEEGRRGEDVSDKCVGTERKASK